MLRVQSRARVFRAPARAVVALPEGRVRCPMCTKPVMLTKHGVRAHNTPQRYPCAGADYIMRKVQ